MQLLRFTIFGALALGALSTGCSRVHLGTHDGGAPIPDAGPRVQCGDVLCEEGLVCCNASCGICTEPGGGCPTIECVDTCASNADCSSTEYCAWPEGACGGDGRCEPRPEVCSPIAGATCGCNGVTYANPCDAAGAGVSVRHEGPCMRTPCDPQDAFGEGPCDAELGVRWNGASCETLSGCGCVGADCGALFSDVASCEAAYAMCLSGGCVSDAGCDFGLFCQFPTGTCGGLGACAPIPGELPCDPMSSPVCGCDGRTYACELAAAQSAVSVLYAGNCETGCAAMDVTGVGGCEIVLGVAWNGAACVSLSGCSCAGADCGALYGTFEECRAARAGCERMPGSSCGGPVGDACRPDEYCDFPDPNRCGAGGEPGVCRPRPEVCDSVIAPACGCDGARYDNACLAYANGWDTLGSDASGGCGAPPPG